MTKLTTIGKSFLIFLGFLAVISGYYVYHKPINGDQVLRLGGALFRLITAWGMILIAGGGGRMLFLGAELEPAERILVQTSLGLGVMGTGMLLLGATAGYAAWQLWLMTAGLGFLLRKKILGWIQDGRKLGLDLGGKSVWVRFLRSYLILVFGLTLLNALAPVTQFDSLVYHLALPKKYLANRAFRFVPELIYWGMPQLTEMLFTWAGGLAGNSTGLVLGWGIGLVAVVGMAGFFKDKFGEGPAYVGAAALLAGFTTAQSLGWGYVNWLNMLFGSALVVVFSRWYDLITEQDQHNMSGRRGFILESRRWLVLAGALSGFLISVKYTSGMFFLLGAWLILEPRVKSKKIRTAIYELGLFFIVGIVIFLPWMIKNYLAVKNPFYPLLFPSGTMTEFRLDFYQNQPRFDTWWQLLVLPLRATILGREGATGYGATIGPLLFPLALMGVLRRKEAHSLPKTTLQVLGKITVGGLIIWAAASIFSGFLIQTRLYYGIFPAAAGLAAAGYSAVSEIRFPKVRMGRLINSMVILVLVLSSFQLLVYNLRKGSIDYFVGMQSQEQFLERNLGWYSAAAAAVRSLPLESEVLMLWEPRGYYCLKRCDADEILDRWITDYHRHGGVDQILKAWRAEGYTHILYHNRGAKYIKSTDSRYPGEAWETLDELLRELNTAQDFGGDYQIMRLKGQ